MDGLAWKIQNWKHGDFIRCFSPAIQSWEMSVLRPCGGARAEEQSSFCCTATVALEDSAPWNTRCAGTIFRLVCITTCFCHAFARIGTRLYAHALFAKKTVHPSGWLRGDASLNSSETSFSVVMTWQLKGNHFLKCSAKSLGITTRAKRGGSILAGLNSVIIPTSRHVPKNSKGRVISVRKRPLDVTLA